MKIKLDFIAVKASWSNSSEYIAVWASNRWNYRTRKYD